ncbi:hypothetical protein [Flavobacterium facile]|uniref:hypothetical protein n=1 Tax=Flavobacterium facile TaxID=2893174 RepID=UPI002E7A287B|nr:hypothetical protein [Flavobacterium sp. T-12]
MTNKVNRKYKTKDIEMLTASATIIENAIANKTLLQAKRSTWADPFFENLKTQIQTTTDTFLGKDAAQQMRQATQTVLSIQAQALNDLAEFKVQIEQDFKNTPVQKTEILTQLGFTSYHKAAQKGDQEGLVNLLFQFKNNINTTLNTEIVAKGMAQVTIDQISNYANTLKDANISQETYKGTRKEITDEAITAFNLIYDQVISIAKIASNFYKTDKTKQQQFSFAKVSATLNSKST